MKTFDFYYDFGSPNAYLAHAVMPAFQERTGARAIYRPMLLGGVFKATSNQSPIFAYRGIKGKLPYFQREISRFVEHYGVKYHMNPHFPINTLPLMRGAVAVEGTADEAPYIDAMFRAIWVEGRDMGDPEVIAQALTDAGLNAGRIGALMVDANVKDRLKEATAAAVERGIFGAPTFFAGDEMFYGKDSLPELEWWLKERM